MGIDCHSHSQPLNFDNDSEWTRRRLNANSEIRALGQQGQTQFRFREAVRIPGGGAWDWGGARTTMNIDDLIKAIQVKLGIRADGKAGPETWEAIYQEICVRGRSDERELTASEQPVDERSERNIATLHPRVRPYARALVRQAASRDITVKIICGTRTYQEQDELYAQGRTKPGKVVTRARGGQSNHNFGIAFDVGIFQNGKYLEESPDYRVVGALGEELGLEWGGNWEFVDEPHFQLHPPWGSDKSNDDLLAGLRERVDNGRDVYA